MAVKQKPPAPPNYADGLSTWGSHQPVLRGIGKFMPVRSVIEFGGGLYSTPLFLDRAVFPQLESLITIESDIDWGKKVCAEDTRHEVIVAHSRRFLDVLSGMKAGFVFIDGAGSRIPLVTASLDVAPLFAIHDCQQKELEHLGIKYLRGFNSTIQTVVGSNTMDLSGLKLHEA